MSKPLPPNVTRTPTIEELAKQFGVDDPTRPQDRVLDWVPSNDKRNELYGIRGSAQIDPLVPRGATLPVWRMWGMGPVLDQGAEGACVGFGWTAEAMAYPVVPSPMPTVSVATRNALTLYRRAQQIDEWAGEAYSGTSVLAGAKVCRERGWIDGYRWCYSVSQIRDAVLAEGPVVLGVNWYEGMYSTRRSGLVEISGRLVGGHCITITGYHPNLYIAGESPAYHDVFRWRNSWGPYYGKYGNGFIRRVDLERLMSEGGEACVAVGRRVPKFV